MISSGKWMIIGAGIALSIAILITSWNLWRSRFKSNSSQEEEKKNKSKELILDEYTCKKIPVKEIYSATNNLNALNFIGQGIAGKVYKGVLSNGWHVAIKHIIKDGYVETFVREVTSLSHVRHRNLVSLRGYCEEAEECFLVYELCPNGNLSEWLFGKDKFLSWLQRVDIAFDCARGLQFLHTYREGCIVHRDIKPTNILLGPDFEAKLSDFGLSKVIDHGLSHVSSEVRGTFGYVDPEYRQNRHVNAAGDVYSFGIVLLQILSGMRVLNLNVMKPMPLEKTAKHIVEGGNIAEFADPKLYGEYSKDAFEMVLNLALSCTSYKQQRPSMEQVMKKLEKALELSLRESAMHRISISSDRPLVGKTPYSDGFGFLQK
ncbi:LOW QUALITY PROTEIN: probable receptor-like protein kinase At2g42960 [Dioscorea cayenensis subsp. rotundata]|uniref:LOW QUALITY PROTEIN: probable receptor-like protein kinase At2g42960 n=1 Tax=Dioscorea cayennensis subsp. rotundata TaxID=55577 RepID=A0AB40AY42_DIOCR|nr:LOW QUALITY PROTEIN: probable receptor-like protein kinase At2g42960 [Dioscorea cayenensis subsp. rotundata]